MSKEEVILEIRKRMKELQELAFDRASKFGYDDFQAKAAVVSRVDLGLLLEWIEKQPE